MSSPRPPGHIRSAYLDEVDRTHTSLLCAAIAFAATFAIVRALTYAIREDLVPWGNVSAGGRHIHHYVWGVLLLLVGGLVNLIIDNPRYNPWLALVYGFAAGLVLDEYALLLNLRDVYWAEEGNTSVDIVLSLIALSTVYFAATSFWRRLGREFARSAWHRLRGR